MMLDDTTRTNFNMIYGVKWSNRLFQDFKMSSNALGSGAF